ncbi:PREDICTED: protein TAPT1 homolog [Bactrocera latifrons]|uniref:Protein TAPT1 n=2 Tax=Bactrocera latifrons TaxID=174628 RepID=A0A0K8WD05_BACLA|nr:PREDICTED: protein TAPT1 homolog [Bactrocera latifrons]
MSRAKADADIVTPTKKLRFRGELNFHSRVDENFDDEHKRNSGAGSSAKGINAKQNVENKEHREKEESPSFMDFFKVELTRGYILEHDEERYTARRQKIYSFMRIPRDLERFIVYGIMQCADSFLYIHTFLPVRFVLATWALFSRPIASCLGLRRRSQRLLTPAEICDLLKGTIWIACTFLMLSVDTNRVYHIIKSQSIIKLYIFYNMIEVGDRLLSAFGQDTIDALFWTATEPKNSKREHFGLLTHIVFALIYVLLHSFLIMFQATTLNVAVNSNNKGLLTIMISNNFVELKGSVFKKFDKNNLFQLTCSDVRERFHLAVLLFIVMIQTMKEFDWSMSQFCVMVPDCIAVLVTEVLIDWIKHAFITRFNEIPEFIYREYTTSLAYDMTQTRQKHAFSDHSDLVARRMGFIPFPLGVVLIKAIYSAVSFNNVAAWVLFSLAYIFVLGLRICLTICALGKACKLMKEHQDEKSNSTPSSVTNAPPIGGSGGAASGSNIVNSVSTIAGLSTLSSTPSNSRSRSDTAASPIQPIHQLQRSVTVDQSAFAPTSHNSTSTPKTLKPVQKSTVPLNPNDVELDVKNSLELGATALFSNSDVDLDDVCLNEKVLEPNANANAFVEEELARSEPELSLPQELHDTSLNVSSTATKDSAQLEPPCRVPKRTHKRSESEPSMQSIVGVSETESQA